jgi:hypothetical protein
MTPSERAEYERLLIADIDRMTALAWQSGNLTYKLHSGQRQIWQALNDATAQEALLFISRQWGKSYLSACYGLSYCLRNPYIIVRIAAPTLKQAKDIVSDNIGQYLRRCARRSHYAYEVRLPLEGRKLGTTAWRIRTCKRRQLAWW